MIKSGYSNPNPIKNLAIIIILSLFAFILLINLLPNDIANNLKLKENVGLLEGFTANTRSRIPKLKL